MKIQGILGLKTLAQAGCPAVVEVAVGKVLTEVILPVVTRARTGGKAVHPSQGVTLSSLWNSSPLSGKVSKNCHLAQQQTDQGGHRHLVGQSERLCQQMCRTITLGAAGTLQAHSRGGCDRRKKHLSRVMFLMFTLGEKML